MNYALALLAAALLGAGFVFQQRAAEGAPKAHFLRLSLLADLLRDRRWLAGMAIMVTGQLLSAWAMGHLVLSVTEPLLASNLLFALLFAWPLSRERLARSEVLGAVILIAGVTALSLARSIPAHPVSVGSAGNWPLAAIAVAVVSYGFAAVGRRRTGGVRATLTGVSAGVVFGLQDALTRSAVRLLTVHGVAALLTSWPAYALLGVGLTAVWLMQSAFNAGPLYSSLPGITAGEPVTGIVLGIMVFGDRVGAEPALIAVQVAGLAALVAGVILVARGPALAGCRVPDPGGGPAGPARRAVPGRAPGRPGAGDRRVAQRSAGRARAGDETPGNARRT